MTIFTDQIQTHWKSISPLLTFRNEREYDAAVERMNELLDEIGTDETHPLYDLLDTLGLLHGAQDYLQLDVIQERVLQRHAT